MANDQIKKADNGTYYFRANLGFDHSTGKRIQKYRSGFKTKKEAKEEYAKLVLQFASQSLPTEQKRIPFGTFIEDTYLPWYQTQVKESTFENPRRYGAETLLLLLREVYRCHRANRHTELAACPHPGGI